MQNVCRNVGVQLITELKIREGKYKEVPVLKRWIDALAVTPSEAI
jgi:hypothetical protein